MLYQSLLNYVHKMIIEWSHINSLKQNNRSVSPVIAVILMVAVVIVIAASIGAVSFGLTDSISDSPPQADLTADDGTVPIEINGITIDYTSVTITHQSGDNINPENIRVTVNDKPAYATLNPADEFYGYTQFGNPHVLNPWDSIESESISAGDSTVIVIGTGVIESKDQDPSRNRITFNHLADDTLVTLWGTSPNTDLEKSDDIMIESGDTVRMVWESGDKSVPLVEHEVK